MHIQEVTLKMDSLCLLTIVSQLQLALSHPQNNKQSAIIVRDFIAQVSPILAEIDATNQVLIDAGFNRDQFS